MNFVVNSVWEWLFVQGVTVAAILGAAYAAFQLLGIRWLDNWFAERLEQSRHDNATKIEETKYRNNIRANRIEKLYQFEFEVLPEVWKRLDSAFTSTRNFIDKYNDVSNSWTFSEDAAINRKLKEGSKIGHTTSMRSDLFIQDIKKVHANHAEFHNYFISKGIFIQPELKKKIGAFSNVMYDAFAEQEKVKRNLVQGKAPFPKSRLLQEKGFDYLSEIEKEVQSRLWNVNKLET